MQSNTQKFNLKNIRTLLREGFTDGELRRLCYDDFRPVYDQLSREMGKGQVIDRLIEYTERKDLIERLLSVTKELNPKKYKEHQPYHNFIVSPIGPSDPDEESPIAKMGCKSWQIAILSILGIIACGIFATLGVLFLFPFQQPSTNSATKSAVIDKPASETIMLTNPTDIPAPTQTTVPTETPTRVLENTATPVVELPSPQENNLSQDSLTSCNSDNVCISLVSYTISEDKILLSLKIINNGTEAKLVRYRNENIQISDDTGRTYELASSANRDVKQYKFEPGESVTLKSNNSAYNQTSRFEVIGDYRGVISEQAQFLYVTISEFTDTEITWKIRELNPSIGQSRDPSGNVTVSLGESYRGAGLNITLTDYDIVGNNILLTFEFRNESNDNILVRFRNSHIELSDNTGAIYELAESTYRDVEQYDLEPGERIILKGSNSAYNTTNRFDVLGRYKGVVSEQVQDLYVTIPQFMGLTDLRWQIDL
ncbi:MAG: hypothetical protein KDJ65_22250 [Anaerolineae bacterium]|nr:hypothetical protein [Anaerolineae bacterium]